MKRHLLLLCVLVYVAYPFSSTCPRCLASAANNVGRLQSQVLDSIGTTSWSVVCRRRNSPLGTGCHHSSTRLYVRGGATREKVKKTDFEQNSISENEKYGILSRLTFSYASKLMDLAKTKRPLESSDTLHVPGEVVMDKAVPELAQIYNKVRAEAMTVALKRGRNVEKAGESPVVLAKAILMHQRETLIKTGILRLLNTLVQAFPALLVARLLRLVESGAPVKVAIQAALALWSVLSLKMLTENQYFHGVVQYSTQVRGSVAGLIFDKALRLPSSDGASKSDASKNLGVGGVINLMQSDASVIEMTALQLHTIWDGPLQISIYTLLLLKYMGPSVLWGIGVLLLTIPMNAFTLRILNRLRKQENLAKDARNKRTAECISNMKILKLQGWENDFSNAISVERKEEMRQHLKRGSIRALNSAVSNSVPTLVLVVTLIAYAKSGGPIVASTVFTVISLLNQLRFPLLFYPMLIDALANGNNSLKRVSRYLSADELTPYVKHDDVARDEGGSIILNKGNFLWSSKTGVPALCNTELSIKPGEVVAVIGQVGSGKTALIKALLGELQPVPRMVIDHTPHPTNGTLSSPAIMDLPSVTISGPVAYSAQESWLAKGTIKDAILFGRPYNETRYKAAIQDSGLEADIAEVTDDYKSMSDFLQATSAKGMLSHMADVGEGGSSLSGGQRARVALARALYDAEAKVFLLDDPFAALDASVGSSVFTSVTKRLRKEKAAAILVTNDPSIPRRCDKVILMGKCLKSSSPDCSTILDIGTYDELLSRGHDIRTITVDTHDLESLSEENNKLPPSISDTFKVESKAKLSESATVSLNNDTSIALGWDHASTDDGIRLEYDQIRRDEVQFVEDLSKVVANEKKSIKSELLSSAFPVKLSSVDDDMATGAVPASTYMTYFKSVRNPVIIGGMVLAYILANSAQFFQQFVIVKWTDLSSTDALTQALSAKYLRSLVQAAGVVSIFLWLRSFLTLHLGYRSSTFLHNSLLKAVMKAPMSFFDATPSGQLLSRFGKELDVVDRSLPDQIGSVLYCFMQIFFSCAALAGAVTPLMLFPLITLGYVYTGVISNFRPAAMDLKRCESKSRAPIYTHFSEALKGAETIRSIARGREAWGSEHRDLTDSNLSVFYSVKSMDRWLSIRLESLGNVVVFSVATASILLSRRGKLGSGAAGWGLTQALSITGLLNWAVRCLTDLETQMMSVLRITEITDLDASGKMPREQSNPGEALVSKTTKSLLPLSSTSDHGLVESKWPWEGNVKFKDVSLRYNPVSPLILKDLSIDVPAGTTLGVVGRTGSGKSSLLLSLFRILEIEGKGSIEIDGIDIRAVSLTTLRDSLSIIPQDPVLFAGTLLFNLDASGKSSHKSAWDALRKASPELADIFQKGDGLDTIISEGGKNLSVGQRQLVCLARALLRKSKILVLDEATSSVDSKTDAQVQATIREQFVENGVTVITVAHRLDTVLGYDKIVVLGAGSVLEYGSPSQLLRERSGELRKLVDADRIKRHDAVLAPV